MRRFRGSVADPTLPRPAHATLSAMIDFEGEGLLEGLETDEERSARRELLAELMAAGATLDQLRQAVAEDRLSMLPVELHFMRGCVYSLEEAAEQVDLSLDFLVRDRLALGLARPAPGEKVYDDGDLEALRMVKLLLEAGVPEESVLELAQVTGHASARMAQAMIEVFSQVFLRAGDSERDLALRYGQAASNLTPTLGPLTECPVRLHLREIVRHEVVGRERATGRLAGARDITVGFADLVGYTRLGEVLPIQQLGELTARFTRLATEVAEPPVRLVKTIGDAAMLVSPETPPLLTATLALIDAAAAEGDDFPALRAGVARGTALPRAADWYGRPVNLASRLTAIAPPRSVLGTDDVCRTAGEEFTWTAEGEAQLKGISDRVSVFRLTRTG